MARGDLWLPHLDDKESDPARDSDIDHSCMHFPHVRTSKSAAERSRLQKLTSLSYLGGKVRGLFHRQHRDTIVCEEDEESPAAQRNIYDVIRRNEHMHKSKGFDHLAHFRNAAPAVRPVAFRQSVSLPVESYEPSKEQRWCTNCSKCFQRGLSHYDQYCGLDCRTAHRLRVHAPHYLSAQSTSLESEETLAVRAAASRPPPHFTTHPATSQRRVIN